MTISPACENLAKRVGVPALNKGDNAKGQLAKHRAALGTANKRLDATRGCQERQRNDFAKG